MNGKQKVVVLMGVLVIAGMMLFPPCGYVGRSGDLFHTGYRFITASDTHCNAIDGTRLAVQCGVVAVLAFGLCVVFAHKRD